MGPSVDGNSALVSTDLDKNKPVCVTGATGFIAAFVIRDLLKRGWTVHGTVRDLSATAKLAPLRRLEGAEARLKLFAADLSKDAAGFEEALSGCVACLHTATPIHIPTAAGEPPFVKSLEEHEEKQARPALAGTRLVLEAAARAGVKRVVLTSSIAAMRVPLVQPKVLNEDSWSDVETLQKSLLTSSVSSYILAKTQQERMAWSLAKDLDIDLRTICPGLVLGPLVTDHLNFSHEVVLNALQGRGISFAPPAAPGHIQNATTGIVDVREVAHAHILAMEKPEAEGRYLLLAKQLHLADMMSFVKEEFPELLSEVAACTWSVDGCDSPSYVKKTQGEFSVQKIRKLGVEEIPWKESIRETVKSLQHLGYLSKPPPRKRACL